MKVEMVARGFRATEAIQNHIEYKIEPLMLWSRDISLLRVTIGDVNGPRGGEDKYCKIAINIKGSSPIHVQQNSDNLYEAISRCADRVERVLAERQAKRRRRHTHVGTMPQLEMA